MGNVTAISQPVGSKCWAAAMGDCSEKISREHVVSKCLFDTDEIIVQGFSWCLHEPKTIGLTSLVAKILCKAHNSALSDLDSAALDAFNVFREAIRLGNDRGKTKGSALWNLQHMVIDGPRLERWFLKTLINVSCGQEWPIGPGAHKKGTPSIDLIETAFGRRTFENGSGLYMAGYAGEKIDSMDRVSCTTMTEGKNLVIGRFNFRGYTFFLNLLPKKFDALGDWSVLHQQTTCIAACRDDHRT